MSIRAPRNSGTTVDQDCDESTADDDQDGDGHSLDEDCDDTDGSIWQGCEDDEDEDVYGDGSVSARMRDGRVSTAGRPPAAMAGVTTAPERVGGRTVRTPRYAGPPAPLTHRERSTARGR